MIPIIQLFTAIITMAFGFVYALKNPLEIGGMLLNSLAMIIVILVEIKEKLK